MTVSLEPITRDNWRAAGAVRLKPGQLSMVAGYEPVAFVIMAKAALRVAGFEWHPLAVVSDSRIVGVMAMVDELAVRQCFALYNFMIGGEHQGRGLGSAAVLAACDWAAARGASSVRLTVNYANTDVRRLYERLGFVAEGDFDGELGMSRPV
jgi:diamine N-acetyltransferase